ncbi:LAMB3 protein, partial [Amia calva]|nr:LAMB3 protein [Amia calva]
MTGPEVFCSPLGQWKMKCCPCDSRDPSSQNAHRIQNVLSQAGPDRWWQSTKDVNPVTVQFDLDSTFQLSELVLEFKGPRPSALVIERSTDFGVTWQPYMYRACDCSSSFPSISTSSPRTLHDTQCTKMAPVPTNNFYQDHTVQFSPLLQLADVNVPQSQKIESMADFTNLRVNLTKLGRAPPLSNARASSALYALKEMRVQGTCFCHGHANRCLPSATQPSSVQVNSVCDCQHNTAGVNCERCADLYNDLPWRPAEEFNTHQCKRCECNNHSQRCRFDPAVFEASGRVSGGVCEDCQHHTTGPKCDKCAAFYYRNPRSSMNRQDACLRCQCVNDGNGQGRMCDPETGVCLCKANVEGPRCDRCKQGYYGLSPSDPMGCKKCPCSAVGSSRGATCDAVTGQCQCLPHFVGQTCERCAAGYWNPLSGQGCERCNCDPRNSYSSSCDQLTGQCQCRTGYGGRTCTECPDNTYGDVRRGCKPCNCEQAGTMRPGCDKTTGACLCLLGMTGPRCDRCQRGHCDNYPRCVLCPSCFFSLDNDLKGFSSTLARLSSQVTNLPGSSGQDLGPRIVGLEAILRQIRDQLPYPNPIDREITDSITTLNRLKAEAGRLNPDLFPTDQSRALDRQIDDLRASLLLLTQQYNIKREQVTKTVTTDPSGAYSTITTAYKESTDAMKSVEGSQGVVDQSAKLRGDAIDLEGQVQPGNTRALEDLNNQLRTQPNLTPTARKVCGSTRTTPCTPKECGGQLCPGPDAPPCDGRRTCTGALPLGKKALADSEEARSRLRELTSRIQQAAAEIQDTQDSANQARLSTDQLANRIKQARTDMDADMQDTRNFVRQLRDFLTDPTTDPATIQRVSEEVLDTQLPQSMDALRRKLDEIRRIAATLPDSTDVLSKTGPELDRARKLLLEAEKARDKANQMNENVEGLLDNLGSVESSLGEVEKKIRSSTDIVKQVQDNIANVSGGVQTGAVQTDPRSLCNLCTTEEGHLVST